MTFGDMLATAERLGRYIRAQSRVHHTHIGDGRYLIVVESEDETRVISAVGFETVADAEAYAAMLRGQLGLETPAEPRVVEIGGGLAITLPGVGPSKVTAVRVCCIVPAVPPSVLDALELDVRA